MSNINDFRKNIVNVIPIATFIFAALFLAGCGDNEMTKGITGSFPQNGYEKKGCRKLHPL
jgi:hypothetical protein